MAVFLIIVAQFSFLAFHTLAELFSIVISFALFAFALSTHVLSRNNFLLFLACGYLWIGGLDLVHTLVYPGMNVFMEGSGNSAVQFWLSARYGEALLLLAAPFAATREQNGYLLTALFGFIAVGLTGLILSGHFPTGFVPDTGLTDFKIYSEYLIDLILALALIALFRQAHGISRDEKILIAASIVLTMCAEIAFTFYVSVFGLSKMAGHLFKIFSFWMIFQAVVISNLRTPYAALQASEGKFRNLFDNAEVSIWNEDLSDVTQALHRLRQEGVHDLRAHLESTQGLASELAGMVTVIQVNQATLELFGAETEDEFLDWINNSVGLDAIVIFIDAVCAIWDKKRILRSEAEMRTLDGRVIHVIVSFPIPDSENGFHSVPVSIIDITARKQVEEALRDSERQLRLITDALPVAIFYVDADMNYRFVNTTAETMLGRPAAEILRSDVREIFGEETYQQLLPRIRAALSGDAPHG